MPDGKQLLVAIVLGPEAFECDRTGFLRGLDESMKAAYAECLKAYEDAQPTLQGLMSGA